MLLKEEWMSIYYFTWEFQKTMPFYSNKIEESI